MLFLALPVPIGAAAELRLTIVSAKLDARKHKQPVNPRMRVEIKDRILRTEPVSATLAPAWNYDVTLEEADVKSSRFIDLILYDYRGPGPDDERMIAGKRLSPRELLRLGTRHVKIGAADLIYRVERIAKAAVPPPPSLPTVRGRRPDRRPGPPIPPLRLFEAPEHRESRPQPGRVRRSSVAASSSGTGADRLAIQGVIDAHSADLDGCHEQAEDPYGEVALLFSISSDGTPLGVIVEGASANLQKAGECMRRKALRWKFPPSHGVVTARHRLTFSP